MYNGMANSNQNNMFQFDAIILDWVYNCRGL